MFFDLNFKNNENSKELENDLNLLGWNVFLKSCDFCDFSDSKISLIDRINFYNEDFDKINKKVKKMVSYQPKNQ